MIKIRREKIYYFYQAIIKKTIWPFLLIILLTFGTILIIKTDQHPLTLKANNSDVNLTLAEYLPGRYEANTYYQGEIVPSVYPETQPINPIPPYKVARFEWFCWMCNVPSHPLDTCSENQYEDIPIAEAKWDPTIHSMSIGSFATALKSFPSSDYHPQVAVMTKVYLVEGEPYKLDTWKETEIGQKVAQMEIKAYYGAIGLIPIESYFSTDNVWQDLIIEYLKGKLFENNMAQVVDQLMIRGGGMDIRGKVTITGKGNLDGVNYEMDLNQTITNPIGCKTHLPKIMNRNDFVNIFKLSRRFGKSGSGNYNKPLGPNDYLAIYSRVFRIGDTVLQDGTYEVNVSGDISYFLSFGSSSKTIRKKHIDFPSPVTVNVSQDQIETVNVGIPTPL